MRIELALLTGIVFFCCWCAYIIVKMNSSITPNSHQLEAGQQRDLCDQNQNHHHRHHQPSHQAPTFGTIAAPQQQTNQSAYLRHALNALANNGPSQQLYLPARYNQPSLLASQQARQPEANSPVMSYRLPASSTPATTIFGRPGSLEPRAPARPPVGWRPALISDQLIANPPLSSNQDTASQEADQADQDSDSADQEPSSNEDSNEDSSPSSNDSTLQQDIEAANQDLGLQAEGADESQNDNNPEPSSGQQIEERSDERSFSEDLSSENERDRDGRQVSKKARHLINGRPVGRANQQDDYDKVVYEVDLANRQQQQQRQNQGQRQAADVASRNDQNDDQEGESDEESEAEPVASRKQHQHRLSESLKADQWDDDSTNKKKPAKADKLERRSGQSDAEQPEAEVEPSTSTERAGSVPPDESVEFQDLDRLTSSEKFPFMTAARRRRRRRRRRQVDYDEVMPANNNINTTGVLFNLDQARLSGPNFLPAPMSQQLPHEGPEVVFSPPVEPPTNPLGVNNSYSILLNPNQQEAYQISHYPTMMQPLGADSYRIFNSSKGKKKSEKKKKKKYKKKSNKTVKYKAAKAHAMKRKNQSSKGKQKGSKKKSRNKATKNYKEFKGSSRGKKGARGDGQRGSKKGALFHEDRGFKKRGFKKAYQKLETGDHKSYFDEFRDRTHNKKWKNFKDKHHYSRNKVWAGKDKKAFKNYDMKDLKYGKSKHSSFDKKKSSRHKKKAEMYNKQLADKERRKEKLDDSYE